MALNPSCSEYARACSGDTTRVLITRGFRVSTEHLCEACLAAARKDGVRVTEIVVKKAS